MSGREHEPIAAFFPSIDRNLMRDLDRHLRTATPPEPESEQAPHVTELESHEQAQTGPLTRTSDILDAVDQAAAAMAAMHARIQELESHQYELETTNAQLKAKLGELLQIQQAAEASSRADRQRAADAEENAAQHYARAQAMANDLETARGDLQKVSDAISGALSLSSSHQG